MELLWRPLLLRAWTSSCKNWPLCACMHPPLLNVLLRPPTGSSPLVLRCCLLHEWRQLWRRVIPRTSRWFAGCSDRSDDSDLFKWQTGQQQYLIWSQSRETSHGKATAYRSSCIIEAALILGGTTCSLCVHAHQHAHWTEAETIRRGSRW